MLGAMSRGSSPASVGNEQWKLDSFNLTEHISITEIPRSGAKLLNPVK
jgi:hypothetical protein